MTNVCYRQVVHDEIKPSWMFYVKPMGAPYSMPPWSTVQPHSMTKSFVDFLHLKTVGACNKHKTPLIDIHVHHTSLVEALGFV